MAMDSNILGQEIYDALGLDSLLPDADTKAKVLATWKSIAGAVVAHIIANLEIKGVTVTLDTSLNQVFSGGVPVPMDGGAALQLAWKAATLAGAADKATQDNDGTGLVA